MRTVTLESLRTMPAGTIYSVSSPGNDRNRLCQIGIPGGEGHGPEGWILQPGEPFDETIGPKHFPSDADCLQVLEREDLIGLRDCIERAIVAL